MEKNGERNERMREWRAGQENGKRVSMSFSQTKKSFHTHT